MSITPYVLPTRCTRCTGSNETVLSVEFSRTPPPPLLGRFLRHPGNVRDNLPLQDWLRARERDLALCPSPNSGSKSIMTRVTPFYFSPLQTMFLISFAFFVRCTIGGVPRYHREPLVGQQMDPLSFVPVAQISGGVVGGRLPTGDTHSGGVSKTHSIFFLVSSYLCHGPECLRPIL